MRLHRFVSSLRTPRTRTTLALLFIGLVLGSWGPVTNDEMDQATAYHNLRHGSWKVQEFPDQHYKVPFLDFTVTFNIRSMVEYPIGSSALNFLSIPFGVVATGLDAVIPLGMLAGIAAVGIGYLAAGFPAPWVGSTRDKALRSGLLAGGVLFATAVFGLGPGAGQSPDLPYQEAYIAIQLANLTLFAGTVYLLWPVLHRRTNDTWATIVFTLAVGLGAVLFWGQSAKYHSLATFLVVWLLWLHDRASNWRTQLLSGLAVGLSVWNHIGVGAVVLLGFILSELRVAWRLRKVWRDLARRWMWTAAGGLAGLAPFFIENTYFFGNPFFSFYFADTSGASAGAAAGNATAEGAATGLLGSLGRIPEIINGIVGWTGFADFGRNLAYGYVWSKAEGDPIPVLWLSPLLVGFLAFIAYAIRRRPPLHPVTALAIGLVIAQTILYTNYGPKQGFGPDMRFYVHIVPVLGVLAAAAWGPAIARTAPRARRILRNAVLLLLVLVGVTAALTAGLGEAFSLNSRLQLRGYFLAYAAILLGSGVFFYWMSRIRWIKPKPDRLIVWLLTVCLCLVGLWNVFYMLSKPTSVAQEEKDEFASMMLPGMQPVAEFLKTNIFPEINVPPLYDNGTIIYHPDHGNCQKDPSPCPGHPNYRGTESAG